MDCRAARIEPWPDLTRQGLYEIVQRENGSRDAWERRSRFGRHEDVMAKEPERPGLTAETVRALARDSGATEQQIREIISLVGFDRASILREARLAAKDG